MYTITSAIFGLCGGIGAALLVETTRRRVAGVRLERELRHSPGLAGGLGNRAS